MATVGVKGFKNRLETVLFTISTNVRSRPKRAFTFCVN